MGLQFGELNGSFMFFCTNSHHVMTPTHEAIATQHPFLNTKRSQYVHLLEHVIVAKLTRLMLFSVGRHCTVAVGKIQISLSVELWVCIRHHAQCALLFLVVDFLLGTSSCRNQTTMCYAGGCDHSWYIATTF